MKSWWRTQRPASPLLLIAHPRCAGCLHSHCGNCGTGLSSLAGSWGVRREREDRGMAARPGARGCWWVEAVPECPAQSLRRWIPRLNWVMPCLIGEKAEAEREWLSTILLFIHLKKPYALERHYWHTEGNGRTLTEVPEGIVALLGEGDLVDGVSQVAMFQQTAGVLSRIPPVLESFYSGVKPVDHVSTWHSEKHTQTDMRSPSLMCWADAKNTVNMQTATTTVAACREAARCCKNLE